MTEPYNGLPPFEVSSDTSWEAAMSMIFDAENLRERVYRFLELRGDYGATDEEIQRHLGMPANTERPRRRELELMGDICKTNLRRLGVSQRWAAVYTIQE